MRDTSEIGNQTINDLMRLAIVKLSLSVEEGSKLLKVAAIMNESNYAKSITEVPAKYLLNAEQDYAFSDLIVKDLLPTPDDFTPLASTAEYFVTGGYDRVCSAMITEMFEKSGEPGCGTLNLLLETQVVKIDVSNPSQARVETINTNEGVPQELTGIVN